ncbi:uncharacterized protein KY384_006500 [Bacidia gigantensis]|uniref:uncharacterized protein n=1 Tax=Bacidia gigantensis TaxID=2732470 RepID=UPI001D05ABCA|nr:uncharacterized protein KY384_006500 [Bacidia gigantensis]KAG8528811.1 hypothetical protein KY384_006500 [Bacidia gigantensis]
MKSSIFLISSIAYLTSAIPIYSPLDSGSLDFSLKNYISNVAIQDAVLRRIEPFCNNLDNITMDAHGLPPPSPGLKLYHIGLGRGTQNYSCPTDKGETAAPTALGAVAKLYNVTCSTGYYGVDKTNSFTNLVAKQNRDTHMALSLLQSGNHFFPDQGSTPVFNLNMGNPDRDYGVMFSAKKANVTAPADAQTGEDGSAAVPWLKLAVSSPPPSPYTVLPADAASGIKEIYRLNTAGGSAPKTCQGLLGQSFEKEYAAEYWFWH